MSYVIYLLTSPPLRAPSVLGSQCSIISSCPLKTIDTLSLGFFARPSAPLRTARSSLCLFAKRLFQLSTTDYSYLFYLLNFDDLVNPSAFVSKVYVVLINEYLT